MDVSPVVAANYFPLKHELEAEGLSRREVTAPPAAMLRAERRHPRGGVVP